MFFAQNVADTVEYSVDFSDWTAGGATISGSAWSVSPAGPTISGETVAGDVAAAKLAGVSFGEVYRLRAEVTLSTGETVSKTIAVRGAK